MKRIPPDPNVSNETLVEQLKSYAADAPRHHWSRHWMGIAADRIAKLKELAVHRSP
ncbi:hypothetical protein LCGC14_2711160 [marine sediment metagenome]|uniref:Uncharacterized protein n=1 Tax=marine sediment metagenome TaxID=412755 RepID=A0A0F9C4L0_9ZZZZ